MATLTRYTWLQLLSTTLLAGCASSEACDLAERQRSVAGAQATDCGAVEIGDDPTAVDACVEAALREHRPFTAQYEKPGLDSKVVAGYTGNAAGQVFLLMWYRGACNASECETTIAIMECVEPVVDDAPNQTHASPPIRWERLKDERRLCGE